MHFPCLASFAVPLRNSSHYSWTGSSDRDNLNTESKSFLPCKILFHVVGVGRFFSITPLHLLDISNPGKRSEMLVGKFEFKF